MMIPRKHWDRWFIRFLALCFVLVMFSGAWSMEPQFCSVDVQGVTLPPVQAHVTADAFAPVAPDLFDTTPDTPTPVKTMSAFYVAYEDEQPGENQFWPFSGGRKPDYPPQPEQHPEPAKPPIVVTPTKPTQAPQQAPVVNCNSSGYTRQVMYVPYGQTWQSGNRGWFGDGPARRQARRQSRGGVPVIRGIRGLFGGC